MFTGLVQDIGFLLNVERSDRGGRLLLKPQEMQLEQLQAGESIAVNGVCLTLEGVEAGKLRFHTLSETLERSNLGRIKPGERVNLERALRVGDRLGGHFVSGHVDGVAELVLQSEIDNGDWVMQLRIPAGLSAGFIPKGSVALDGVSLTVADLQEDVFSVYLIPETRRRTCLGECCVGDLINLETDLIGKYVLRAMQLQNQEDVSRIDLARIKEAGW